MQDFSYCRPRSVAEAVALLAEHGAGARILAGGTDLVIGLRTEEIRPTAVIDLKRIPELLPPISREDGVLRVSAVAVMAEIEHNEAVLREFPALAEAASVVGSVQIRNRATMVGNVCNASPAADTAPPLLVYDASAVAVSPAGTRRIPLNDFFVRSGQTTLQPGELVTGLEVPFPNRRMGAAYTRLTRRRGTDLASITLCCGVTEDGVTRLAYGSVGPRPVLVLDESGTLADPGAPDEAKSPILEKMLAGASPSPRSMRAGPEYRLAMLRVLGKRALTKAIERLVKGAAA
jgi:CO/xanthine dehydrogenase FAD-binding subunit